MYKLSEIYIYPVKSLGGIKLNSAEVQLRGLRFDRRWMIVDENNIFLTQRRIPSMALIRTEITGNRIKLTHKSKNISSLYLTTGLYSDKQTLVQIFNNNVPAHFVSDDADKWLTETLGVKCRLVFMSGSDIRLINPKYAKQNETVSFADGFPFLIIGQPSMDLLNSKLPKKISVNRFRPNFVFSGGEAHDEDKWKKIKIGEINFEVVKPCARCVITTVNQNNGRKGKEPLATLSLYRKVGNKILFGQNMLTENTGVISTGDKIEILEFNE